MTSFSALILRNHHHILTTVRRRFTTVTPSLTSTFRTLSPTGNLTPSLVRTFSLTGNLTPSLVRTFSTVTQPVTENNVDLTSDQALGKVTAVSDYITRVYVECANSGAWPDDGSPSELMCLVRSSLSKVIPGDDVMVDAIDWDENEGVIENVFERKSEIAQIANVENLMVLFSLDTNGTINV